MCRPLQRRDKSGREMVGFSLVLCCCRYLQHAEHQRSEGTCPWRRLPEERQVGGVICRPIILDVAHLDDAHVEDHCNESFHLVSRHRSPIAIQSGRQLLLGVLVGVRDDIVDKGIAEEQGEAIFWTRTRR